MKKLFVLVIFLGFPSLPSLAQDYPKFEVFGGYQYTRTTSGISLVRNADGWDGSFTYNFNDKMGVSGDINGAYQHACLEGSCEPFRYLSFAGGPVFHLTSKSRAKPYLHALFGGMRETVPSSGVWYITPSSAISLAILLGGGVDVKLNKHFSLRLAQADWVYYSKLWAVSGVPFGTSRVGTFKVATGLVYTFGGKKGD